MDAISPAYPAEPAYPRPQLVRPLWASLDGWWEFAFDDAECGVADQWYDGRSLPLQIRVPFPYQAAASGIGTKDVHEVVWYARSFAVPPDWRFAVQSTDLLLHFGAVDYSTEAWVNGRLVGRNRGGHVPFHFNIAPF